MSFFLKLSVSFQTDAILPTHQWYCSPSMSVTLQNLQRKHTLLHTLRHAHSSEDHCLFSQPLSPPSSFLSFFLFFYIFYFLKKGCTRNVIYFTFPWCKASLSRKFFSHTLHKILNVHSSSSSSQPCLVTSASYLLLYPPPPHPTPTLPPPTPTPKVTACI